MAYDIWFEMKQGEYFLHHQTFDDAFTFTIPGKKVINQEWLMEVIFFLIYRFSGSHGLIIFNTLMIALIFYILYQIMKTEHIDPYIGFWILFLTLIMIRFRLLVRPHMISLFFIILFFYFLNNYKNGRIKHLFLLPLLTILWTNLHFGSVFGLILIGCYFAGYFVQTIFPSWNRGEAPPTMSITKRNHLFMILTLCGLAALINPFGAAFYTFPLEVTRLGLKYKIIECLSPLAISKTHIILPLFWLMLLAYIFIIFASIRHMEIVDLLIFSITLIFALKILRFIPEFALLNAPIMAKQLSRWKKKISPEFSIPFLKKRFFIAVTSLSICLIMMFSARSYLKNYEFGYGIDTPTQASFDAADFLVNNNIQGNIFNEMRYGGHILWKAFPKNKIYVYGRYTAFGEPLLNEYFDILGATGDWQEKLKRYQVNIAFLGRETSKLFFELARSKEWTMVYYNQNVSVFLRNVPEFQSLINRLRVEIIDTEQL